MATSPFASGRTPTTDEWNQICEFILGNTSGSSPNRVVKSLIAIRTFASGTGATYTPTTGTNDIYFCLVAGGGSGAGAAASTAGNISLGGGGAGGSILIAYIAGISGTGTYTIGAGGIGVSAAAGNAGGDSTLAIGGITYTAKGGGVSAVLANGNAAAIQLGGDGVIATQSSGTNAILLGTGCDGGAGMRLSGTVGISGYGGQSPLSGGQPRGRSSTFGGRNGPIYGAGGSGALSAGGGAAQTGGNGADGVLIIWEFR